MIVTYETKNSIYEHDVENRRYRRSKREGGMESVHSHRLTYDDWHDLADREDAFIVADYWNGEKVLRIWEVSSVKGITTSPLVNVD